MKIKSIIFIILPVFLILSCIPSTTRYTEKRIAITRSGIPVTLIIYAERRPDWSAIFTYLESKAQLYDHRIQDSPVQELNTYYEAQLPDEVFKAFDTALDIAEKSNGAFDPTILPLTRLWDFDNMPILPDPQDITSAVNLIDYKKVMIPGNNMVRIPENYGIDLGGIAKGALVDSLADYLHSSGYENFLIEAGGDIILSGLKPGNEMWTVGILHPRDRRLRAGDLSLGTTGGRIAIVTSGDYEKFFMQDGIKYHHIINPSTGYPAKDVISVTVIAPACTEADALATAAFVFGKEEGLRLLEKEKDTEGLFIYEENGVLKTVMTEKFSSLFYQRL